MAERNASPLEITVEQAVDEATVIVRGEIDLETSGELAAAFAELSRPGRVHVDLGGVDYMDSTGLRALLAARAGLEERGAVLDVVNASAIVVRLLEITGLDDLLSETREPAPSED